MSLKLVHRFAISARMAGREGLIANQVMHLRQLADVANRTLPIFSLWLQLNKLKLF